MESGALGRRFWETTRGQVVALLRRSKSTVEDLARTLGVTDNAVRSHLASLERDGLVRQDGVRRGVGAGKPAVLYEVHPDAAPLLSRAYAPVLAAVMDVLIDDLPSAQSETVLRRVGSRLASAVGGRATGDLDARVAGAARVLTALGGDVETGQTPTGLSIRGAACPLSTVVSQHPSMCLAVETLVGEVVGGRVQSRCEHGPNPRCCFLVDRADHAA